MKTTAIKIILTILLASLTFSSFCQERISDWRSSTNISSDPNGFTRFGDKVYFAATDFDNGTSVWVTNGTPEGTEIFQKGERKNNRYWKPKTVDDTLYYVFDQAIWKMALGTNEIIKIASLDERFEGLSSPIKVKNRIWFSLNKSYDILKGKWESTSNFTKKGEDNYPYNYGYLSQTENFLLYQYYDIGIGEIGGRHIEVRDSTNKRYFYKVETATDRLLTAFSVDNKRYFINEKLYPKTLNLYEIGTDSLILLSSDTINIGYPRGAISSYSKEKGGFFSTDLRNSLSYYSYGPKGIKHLITSQSYKPGRPYKSLYINNKSHYFIEADISSSQLNFYRLDYLEDKIKLLESFDNISFSNLNGNFFSLERDSASLSYEFDLENEVIHLFPARRQWYEKVELNDSKIGSINGESGPEPYAVNSDTLLLKNIMTNGGMTDLFPFRKDDKIYFSFNEAEKGFTIHELDAESNSFLEVYTSPERLTVLYSDLYFRFENKKLNKVASFGRSEKGNFILLKNNDEDHFQKDYVDFVPERAFFNSVEDVIYSEEGELLKYSLKDKVAKPIWKNGGFNTLQDLITKLRYKDYVFKVTTKNIYAFNTVSENLTVLQHNSETTPFLWQNRLISVSNDSLNLYEIDENFRKRTLAIGVDVGSYLKYQFSDSTFTILTNSQAVISNGTCEETKSFQIVEGKYQEVNLLNANIPSDNYAIYKSGSQDLIIYGLKDSLLIHLPDFLLYGSIKTDKAIYYLNSKKDALNRLDLITGISTSVSTFDLNSIPKPNHLSIIYQNQETATLYFTTAEKLFRLDLMTDAVYECEGQSLGSNSEYISEGSGQVDLSVIRGKPYLIDKTDLRLFPIPWDSLSYLRSYNSDVKELKNHWLLNYEKGIMLINKYSLVQQVFNFPTGVSGTNQTFVQNNKVYTIATDEKYGYQVWYIAEIEGLEEIVVDDSKAQFAKLPDNTCFQPLATEEPNEVEILVYPNPHKGRFNVQLPKELTNAKFEMYETSGRKVDFESWQIDNSNYTLTIDNSSLQSLILKVVTHEKTISKKVIQSE